jgi:hypothetical protein
MTKFNLIYGKFARGGVVKANSFPIVSHGAFTPFAKEITESYSKWVVPPNDYGSTINQIKEDLNVSIDDTASES